MEKSNSNHAGIPCILHQFALNFIHNIFLHANASPPFMFFLKEQLKSSAEVALEAERSLKERTHKLLSVEVQLQQSRAEVDQQRSATARATAKLSEVEKERQDIKQKLESTVG